MMCDCCGSTTWRFSFSEGAFRLGQCETCRLHYVDAMPPQHVRLTEMETGHFAGTEQVLGPRRQLASERAQQATFQTYVDLAKCYVSEGRWLDIGCGGGVLISLAKRSGYEVEGIELTTDRRNLARQVTGLVIHALPVEEMELPDNYFDVITLINVFSHLTRPSATLKELRRILSPNGVLIIATGVVGDGVKKSHLFKWSLGDHLYFLGEGTLERYACDVGFVIVKEHRQWAPAAMLTKKQLSIKGRSRARNALKCVIRYAPGALSLIRRIVFRKQADNAVFPTVFMLQRDDPREPSAEGGSLRTR